MSWTLSDQTVTLISILVSVIIVNKHISSTKEREIDFKVHQQRKEQYSKLIHLLIQIFASVKNTTTALNQKENANTKEDTNCPFSQNDWFDVQLGMSMYASEEVLKAYLTMMDASRQKSEPPMMINIRLGNLILMMRKEVGFKDSKNLTCRDVLGTFITDINDPIYDRYFESSITDINDIR